MHEIYNKNKFSILTKHRNIISKKRKKKKNIYIYNYD